MSSETSNSLNAVRVLIAASGTGGHLIPAVHIANALKKKSPGCVVEFIGAGKPLEDTLVVQKGYVRHVVAAAGVKRLGIRGLVSFFIKLPRAVTQLLSLYNQFKPSIVVGVGGYVSVLPIILARMKGIPTWAHEAEKHPGLANKVLGFFARNFSVAFEGTTIRGGSRIVVTGHPVRPELRSVDRDTVRSEVPLRLLLLGGSQGARGIDNSVPAIAPTLVEKGIEVVHQCRAESVGEVAAAYKTAGVKAHVVSFIDDMAGAYEWSDIIISRAGAGSVAEISCVNRPTIFVPYPFQQGTHQTDNAKTLVSKEKALLVFETEPDFPTKLNEALKELCTPANYKRMKAAECKPRGLEAAETIAHELLQIAALPTST